MDKKTVCAGATAFLLALPATGTFAAGNTDSTLGESASPALAARTITITPDTTWVEVKNDEIVRFAVGKQLFAWHFNGINTLSEIDLNKIAPAGSLNRLIQVYINRMPDYDGA